MAKIIYKEGCEGQNRLECIEGIEIELLNGQKALIYPKYAERVLLEIEKIGKWGATKKTLMAAMELQRQKKEIDVLAETIEGADLLRNFISCAWSCSRHHKDSGWIGSGDYGCASSYYLYARHLTVPVVLYR